MELVRQTDNRPLSIWEEVEAEYACRHATREVRYGIASNGHRQYRDQCVTCGDVTEALKHGHPRVMALVTPVAIDSDLKEAHRQKIRLEAQRRITEQNDLDLMERLRERDQESTAWWAEYNEYLQSGDWQARRLLVLKRDGGMCTACGQATATEVHHKTYDHGFDAPLFDLESVCSPCHDKITVLDRERRERQRNAA